MIRSSKDTDIGSILEIWLEASIKAHDLMPPAYWHSKVDDMRNIYLPFSENYIYEYNGKLIGFVAIYRGTLVAIFVSPLKQGEGIGSKLIEFVKGKCKELNLTVYKNNTASISFYEKHGFAKCKEQLDENTGHHEIVMKLNSLSGVP